MERRPHLLHCILHKTAKHLVKAVNSMGVLEDAEHSLLQCLLNKTNRLDIFFHFLASMQYIFNPFISLVHFHMLMAMYL